MKQINKENYLTQQRPNTDLAVLETPMEWLRDFQKGWLAHFEKTGKSDWRKYVRPQNRMAPTGPGLDLSESRLMLISSAGAYLKDKQEQFNETNPLGDYSIRLIPSNTSFEEIRFAQTDYDHDNVNADPQILLPLRHLEDLAAEGIIGELAPVVVSYSGYQPDMIRVVKEIIPPILNTAKEFRVQAALLVPSSTLCIQSVGLISRALEVNGIASTLTSWKEEITRAVAPPRATTTRLVSGNTLGMPGDAPQQRRVLETTLELLAHDAPLDILQLDESGG